MPLFAYDFWNRVDALKGNVKLSKIAEETGVNYQTLRNQRSENRYPKRDDIAKIAEYLKTTEEYLMTGICPGLPKTTDYDYVVHAMDEDPELIDIFVRITKKIKGDS